MRYARHKFGATQAVRDGQKFSSKKEAVFYDKLVYCRDLPPHEVSFFLRQVPFHLPGGVKYIVDFQVFWADGRVSFIDVKGHRTESYKAKKRMVETLYPIEIEEA